MRNLITILIVLVSFGMHAQDNATFQKKKVLIIPMNRMAFQSEVPLSDIGEINEIKSSEVFNTYQEEIIGSFIDVQDDNFEFVNVDMSVFNPLKQYLDFGYSKGRKKRYYTVSIDRIPKSSFEHLMEYHQADFVLFVNWYSIKKETYLTIGKKNNRLPYSGHYIDYDVYNLFGQKVFGEGNLKAKIDVKSEDELQYRSLRLKELKGGFNKWVKHVIERLNNPLNNK